MLINSLWPGDAIWRHKSGSTLVQVMACCLTAPSHYLNQCWPVISEVPWHSAKSNFPVRAQAIFCLKNLKIRLLKWLPHLPGANELKEPERVCVIWVKTDFPLDGLDILLRATALHVFCVLTWSLQFQIKRILPATIGSFTPIHPIIPLLYIIHLVLADECWVTVVAQGLLIKRPLEVDGRMGQHLTAQEGSGSGGCSKLVRDVSGPSRQVWQWNRYIYRERKREL